MTSPTGGFTDLRVHRATEGTHADDSVWPSFTDIMMVVVMIFLMSSVIFMLRNVQLNDELASAKTAETVVLEEMASLRERAAYLATIIEQTQSRLATVEIERDQLVAQAEERTLRIADLRTETITLHEIQEKLKLEISSLNQEISGYRSERSVLTERIASMNQTVSDLQDLIKDKNHELADLESLYEHKQQELLAVEEQLQSLNSQFASLQVEHADLQIVESSQREKIQILTEIQLQKNLELAAQLEAYQQLTEQFEDQNTTLEVLRLDYADLNRDQQQELLKTARLAATVDLLSDQLQEKEIAISKLSESETLSAQTLQEQALTLSELETRHSKLSRKFDEIVRQYMAQSEEVQEYMLASVDHQQQIEGLTTLSLQQTQDIDELESAYANRVVELDRLHSEMKLREQEMAELQQVLAAQKSETQNLLDINEEYALKIAAMSQESDHAIEQQSAMLEQIRQQYDSQLRENETSMNVLIAERDDLLDDISSLQAQNEEHIREALLSEEIRREEDEKMQSLRLELSKVSNSHSKLQEQLDALNLEREQLLSSGIGTEIELAALKVAYQQRLKELAELETDFANRSTEAQELRSEIVELKDELQVLLRPARSPANRYIVEIKHFKTDDGKSQITYKLPGDADFQRISRAELDTLLTRLKAERPEGLYTRIIIPDDSGLLYNEAWKFTQSVLSKYDYYHNES